VVRRARSARGDARGTRLIIPPGEDDRMGVARAAAWPLLALADLLWPERCLLCGADPAAVPWLAAGGRARGLRAWDRPHLCAACAGRLAPAPSLHRLAVADGAGLAVAAGRPADAELVRLVSAMKYQGVRGAAWTLSALLVAAARRLPAAEWSGGAVLVPVPLHPSRRRERGFNQAELLARLAGERLGCPCATEALRRRRATPQQAKLAVAGPTRARNVAGAFAAPASPAGATRAVLVDDLATTGHTLGAAAAALAAGGWTVVGALVAGAAAGLGAGGDGAGGGP